MLLLKTHFEKVLFFLKLEGVFLAASALIAYCKLPAYLPQAFDYSFSTHPKYNEIPALKARGWEMKEENKLLFSCLEVAAAKNNTDSSGATSVTSSHAPSSAMLTALRFYLAEGAPQQINEQKKSEGKYRLQEVGEGPPGRPGWTQTNRSKQMLHNHNFSKIILAIQGNHGSPKAFNQSIFL